MTIEGDRRVIQDPEVRADTLSGTFAEGDSVNVALEDIRGLEVRKTSTWKTTGLAYLLLNVVMGVALFASGTDVAPNFGEGG